MDEPRFKVDVWFGHVEMQSRRKWLSPTRMTYEGRSLWFDQHGALTKVGEWSQCGPVLDFDPPKPKGPIRRFLDAIGATA